MGFLLIDGKPALRNGKLLVGDDFDCCCDGIACCEGPLTCERAVADFFPGISCLNPNNIHRVTVVWQWTANADGSCRFFWDIQDVDAIGVGITGLVDYANAQCTDPVGVWVPGLAFTDKQFIYDGRPFPGDFCKFSNATVTIEKTTNGYSFWLQGVEEVDGFFCGDCAEMDATYVVECV